jgi:predicted lipoprotein with Yx(FWY)xxD motif
MTLLAVAGAAAGASVAVASASGAHAASAAVVSTRSTSLGTVLVGPNGHTLYLDKSDSKDKSTCSGGCASVWPPLTTKGKPTAKGAAKASELSTFNRGGGVEQVAYDGHPLYYFASDTAAGQTSGEGSGGFYVVSPSGAAITKKPVKKKPGSSTPGY